MRTQIVMAAVVLFIGAMALPFAGVAADSKPTAKEAKENADKRAAIRKESQNTLAKLYKAKPSARTAIQSAAGYAAFDNFGLNLFVLSTASGKGLVVDNSTKKQTFMKMVSAGVGIGLGGKDFRVVFVFENKKALNDFLNSGWDADAHAEASAKSGKKGGAYEGATSVSQGVWVYQMTETGLALHATLQGTKYYKDKDLN